MATFVVLRQPVTILVRVFTTLDNLTNDLYHTPQLSQASTTDYIYSLQETCCCRKAREGRGRGQLNGHSMSGTRPAIDACKNEEFTIFPTIFNLSCLFFIGWLRRYQSCYRSGQGDRNLLCHQWCFGHCSTHPHHWKQLCSFLQERKEKRTGKNYILLNSQKCKPNRFCIF